MTGTKKKVTIIGVSAIVLVAMVVAVTVGVNRAHNKAAGGEISTSTKAIKSICQSTDYKETCEKGLSSTAGNTSDPKELVKAAFQVAINEMKSAAKNSTTWKELMNDPKSSHAVEICGELLDKSIIDLQRSIEKIGQFETSKLNDFVEDLKIWLSGSLTYQTTCFDLFEGRTDDSGEKMKKLLKTARELTINGLNIVTEISSLLTGLQIPGVSRRLLSQQAEGSVKEFPSWITAGQRRLLQATPATIKPDLIVAKDGSGKYKTIKEAVKVIPMNSTKRFVVYVKQGVYNEQVLLPKGMNNVMFIGDGPTKTKITGSLNKAEGYEIIKSATFAAEGDAFIAKDMGFENTAGPNKGQALALRVESTKSIIYNCQVDGHQDTLWAVAYEQFYRDCTISGTIDFIFGNAKAVFQNCKVIVRSPGPKNNQCYVTAGGREFRNESTALVLQNCTISPSPEFLESKKTQPLEVYLGRPWKPFSRTIITQSQIDGFIDPKGWTPFRGNFGLNTCFFAEVGNRGPGSVLTKRVTWRGIKKITPQHALDFTAGKFLRADQWIKPTGVPYVSGMIAGL